MRPAEREARAPAAALPMRRAVVGHDFGAVPFGRAQRVTTAPSCRSHQGQGERQAISDT